MRRKPCCAGLSAITPGGVAEVGQIMIPSPSAKTRALAGFFGVLIGLCILPVYALDIGRFAAVSDSLPEPWQVLQLNAQVPATRYRLREWDGVIAIEAKAQASMALLARPVDIDLSTMPVLCWRWRIDAPLRSADMRSKSGDDYAARVYITFVLKPESMDLATRTKLRIGRALFGQHLPDAALNYVWDNRQPIGTRQANTYTDRARMIVLRSGAADAGRWVTERRDVLADARHEFGDGLLGVRQLALASDTDNTGEAAQAGFADLHFVPRDESCRF